ncbi:hypothetical protein [Burkholderia pseudomallei]|uniref:hypothetical protein n=1 Tax=Burkholderia pseudomallei TaxID=28450 RepID=UPI001AAF07EC|nr:hypothetical protein [Burkholderia pseudomallei]MBO2984123.1 hypothetical protein [Burkholderia pseudomallei]MBO7916223.1 hypothetical protein [Burkholderia pseudomallei]
MSAFVELPEGDLIGFLDLARALARAVQPVTQPGALGMDCVIGKVQYCRVPNPNYRTSVGPNSETHQRAEDSVAMSEAAECPLPSITLGPLALSDLPLANDDATVAPTRILRLQSDLSDDEHIHLAKLLQKLPRLSYPISPENQAEFLTAFRKLAGKKSLNWEPCLLTAADVQSQQDKQDSLNRDFQRALSEEFRRGRLAMCSSDRVPVEDVGRGITLNYFIPRQSALDCVTRLGLAIQPTGKNRADVIYRFYTELAKQRTDKLAVMTAERLGVSDSYVRRIVRERDPKRKEAQAKKTSSRVYKLLHGTKRPLSSE